MIKISVIIPYFQRQKGILRRALESILNQKIPSDIMVEVIVVDDASPVVAEQETEGLGFTAPFALRVIKQPNGGAGAARNTGLMAVDGKTTYVAFLDSDDLWYEGHLSQAVAALEQGNDFYFCDNKRIGVHPSQFAAGGIILDYIKNAASERRIISLSRDEICSLVIKECPTQASTVLYRRSCAPDILFDTSLKKAGEDKVFFAQLVGGMQRICFSPYIMVDCGEGINMYFSNLNWDSPEHLKVVIDDAKAHNKIRNIVKLTPEDNTWNNANIGRLHRKLVFLSLRYLLKTKGKFPEEVSALIREDKEFRNWFVVYAAEVMLGKLLGIYKPA